MHENKKLIISYARELLKMTYSKHAGPLSLEHFSGCEFNFHGAGFVMKGVPGGGVFAIFEGGNR